MLISCWCWWWTAGWSCYCCWFLRGRDCSSSCRLGGEWTLTEWTRLSAPLSSGSSTHSLLLRPGCWPREAQAILSSLFKFGIFVFVFVFISIVLVFTFSPSPLPPAGYWPCYFSSSPPCKVLVFALTICGYVHQVICSFFKFKLNSHIVWKGFSGSGIKQKIVVSLLTPLWCPCLDFENSCEIAMREIMQLISPTICHVLDNVQGAIVFDNSFPSLSYFATSWFDFWYWK